MLPNTLLVDENLTPQCATEDKNMLSLAIVTASETIESESLFNGVPQSCINDICQSSINLEYEGLSLSAGLIIISESGARIA